MAFLPRSFRFCCRSVCKLWNAALNSGSSSTILFSCPQLTEIKSWSVPFPTAMADYDGKIFVASEPAQIFVFSEDGELERTWTTGRDIQQLAFDEEGLLYVPCYDAEEIQVYSREGELLKQFSADANGIAINDGLIYATGTSRISIYDLSGTLIRVWELDQLEAEASSLCSIAVTSNDIYVLDSESCMIHVFSKKGKRLRSFGEGQFLQPLDITVVGEWIYACDRTGRVLVFDTEGHPLTIWGEEGFCPSCSLAHGNFLYIAGAGSMKCMSVHAGSLTREEVRGLIVNKS